MRQVFSAAIGRVGGQAELYREETLLGQCAASLHAKSGVGEEAGLAIGSYSRRQMVLYASCGGAADLLQKGDSIQLAGNRYSVQLVEGVLYEGSPVYYRIWALPEQEGSW